MMINPVRCRYVVWTFAAFIRIAQAWYWLQSHAPITYLYVLQNGWPSRLPGAIFTRTP